MSQVDDVLSGIDLTGDNYTVEQALIRNKYKAMDGNGNVVLRGKQKMLKMKEEFPFTDADGNDVFTVKAGGILDVAGDYMMTDAQTGEDVMIMDRKWSIFTDQWRLRDPETEELIAEINSRSTIFGVLRALHDLFSLLPHKYEITDADGGHVGTIAGQFSLKDRYEITIDDASKVPKEAVVAAAMVIDAIEGN